MLVLLERGRECVWVYNFAAFLLVGPRSVSSKSFPTDPGFLFPLRVPLGRTRKVGSGGRAEALVAEVARWLMYRAKVFLVYLQCSSRQGEEDGPFRCPRVPEG